MRYMGSKARLSKHLVPIIMKYYTGSQTYVEPFVGGGNMIRNIPIKHKIGNDICPYSIALLRYLSEGGDIGIFKEIIDKNFYLEVKKDKEAFKPYLVGFLGYCCSFGGKFFGGYAKGFKADKITPRDLVDEQIRALNKYKGDLQNIEFTCGNYLDLKIPDGSLVYCDPPYTGTTGYSTNINEEEFKNWCEALSEKSTVFVSGYQAPESWDILWEKEVVSDLTVKGKGKRNTEKLFLVNSSGEK